MCVLSVVYRKQNRRDMRIRELIRTLIDKDVDDELYIQVGNKMRKVTGAIPRESDTNPRYYTEIMLESEKNEPVADTCPPSVTYINMDTMDPVVEETDFDRNPTPEQAARNYEKYLEDYGLTADPRDLFLAGVCWAREQGETIEGWLDDENKPPYDCILVPDGKIPWGDFKYGEKVIIQVRKKNA